MKAAQDRSLRFGNWGHERHQHLVPQSFRTLSDLVSAEAVIC